jgi:uncharacterized membrane protein
MYDVAIIWDWISFAVRWLHVITAMAWIGSSFYFIALDLGLNRNIEGSADGEEWQVHGGGFYHIQKYLVAPEAMPEHLTWFKWESYTTWLSGVAMLMVVYWAGSELYMIDPAKMDLTTWQAIAISAGSLAIGWVIYDSLCKSPLGERPTLLMLLLFAVLVAMSWGYNQIFHRPRGAFAFGRVYCDHHDGQCGNDHHAQSENRGGGFESWARAGGQIWQDCQIALNP